MSENFITSAEREWNDAQTERVAEVARRAALINGYGDWIATFAPWKSFLTLTVANEHSCSRDTMARRWRSLVKVLDRDLYGNHYARIVGHCYFSYVVGFEYTTAHAVHLHVLVDKPINFDLVHRYWNVASGFAYIEPVTNRLGVAYYLCKYVIKGQDLIFHKPKKSPLPAFQPSWFADHV